MDDIDRRIAAAPPFPGLRRFHEGRNFSQWTGNDSKALMKVYLPALVGYVPDNMVKCFAAFLDFCYLARRSSHDTQSLESMNNALAQFHELRVVFEDAGVRPNGFSLPRQHALVHYVQNIQLFGSPNGLCSSITESRHITAVKRPWRQSNRNNPLGQMIRTNTRLSKLAAARVEFGRRDALRQVGHDFEEDMDSGDEVEEEHEVGAVGGPVVESFVSLAKRPVYVRKPAVLAAELGQPQLLELVRRFLYDQLYPDDELAGADLPLEDCPVFRGRISVYHSASAVFYAPSELAGPGGMHREMIRSNPAWLQEYPRFDTVLVQNGPEDDVMGGPIDRAVDCGA
ncbi:hypothetical protein HYDPIDRAFT_167325 [Hydnomerulius pinastri MD-312]|nr:hypothetical protein HYDPIDRAFT_167325 [Hydnomerulius pinastri MD-312]